MTRTLHHILALFALAGSLMLAPGVATAQTASILPASSAPAATVGETRPVMGWVKFCDRHPSECEVDLSEPAVVTLSPKVWQTIVSVNAKVNGTIKPLTDQEHWGVADSWDFPNDGAGDCEDYQLLKRKLLVDAGLPRRAMRMTVVIDEKGEGHAVLMIRTDRGDFVLDNKAQAVLPWHQTGYIFVKREGDQGIAWTSLGGAMSPITTANR